MSRAHAVEIARESDVALLFLGLPAAEESEGFDRVRFTGDAVVRVSARLAGRMYDVSYPALVKAVAAATPEPDGSVVVTIPIESIQHAHDELLRLGAEAEVLAPAELRERLAHTAVALAARYETARECHRAGLA